MNPVTTKDGSITYFNKEFQEHYHTTTGAKEEAVKKFAEPHRAFLEGKDAITVLDMCFGLGYNSMAFLDLFAGRFSSITLACFEADITILKKIRKEELPFASAELVASFVSAYVEKEKTRYRTIWNQSSIILDLVMGDATTTIKNQSSDSFDAVLFDPFSPKKHPALWSKSFLGEIKRVMREGAALTTYSCARSFRDTLRELDFVVINGPVVGRRAPSTIGIKRKKP